MSRIANNSPEKSDPRDAASAIREAKNAENGECVATVRAGAPVNRETSAAYAGAAVKAAVVAVDAAAAAGGHADDENDGADSFVHALAVAASAAADAYAATVGILFADVEGIDESVAYAIDASGCAGEAAHQLGEAVKARALAKG